MPFDHVSLCYCCVWGCDCGLWLPRTVLLCFVSDETQQMGPWLGPSAGTTTSRRRAFITPTEGYLASRKPVMRVIEPVTHFLRGSAVSSLPLA